MKTRPSPAGTDTTGIASAGWRTAQLFLCRWSRALLGSGEAGAGQHHRQALGPAHVQVAAAAAALRAVGGVGLDGDERALAKRHGERVEVAADRGVPSAHRASMVEIGLVVVHVEWQERGRQPTHVRRLKADRRRGLPVQRVVDPEAVDDDLGPVDQKCWRTPWVAPADSV